MDIEEDKPEPGVVVEESVLGRKCRTACACLYSAASSCASFCRALRDVENHYLGNHVRSLYATGQIGSDKDRKEIQKANLPVIWISGGPGAPIQAIAHNLAQTYNFHHVYVGGILSKEIELGTNQSEVSHQLMYRGMIVPRAFVVEIVKRDMVQAIKKTKKARGFIFSDYPTTRDEAKYFIDKVCRVDSVIVLKFSELAMNMNAFQLLRAQSYSSQHLSLNKEELRLAAETAVRDYSSNLKLISKLVRKTRVVDGQLELKDAYRQLKNLIDEAIALRNKVPPVVEVKSPVRHV